VAIVGALVVLVVVLLSARSIASFYIDSLWFRSVGRSDVFWGTLWVKVIMGVGGLVLFAGLCFASLTIADRAAPVVHLGGPEQEVLERFRAFVEPRKVALRAAISVAFGLIIGLPASSHWQDWLLFRNAVSFNTSDPQFHQDVSWYVFRLPFLNFLIGWLLAAVIVVTLVTLIAHYLNGGIRTSGPAPHATTQVKLHLSLLLAAMAVLKAGQYWLRRYGLTTSTRGFVQGAGYTDVKAALPALDLLILISLAAAVLLIWNVRQRGWRLPVIAVGLWAVVALVAGTLYPAVVQKFRVEPSQSKRERPYIARNITATQKAFALDTAVNKAVPVGFSSVTTSDVQAATASLANARLLDPKQDAIKQAFIQQQRPQGFYDFTDLDVDRYTVNGTLQQVIVAARVVAAKLPNSSWENTHLAYTHGYGLVAAPASKVLADGRPAYLPQTNNTSLGVTRPQIYVGDGMPGSYVVLKSSRADGEIGPTGPGEQYTGNGGVPAGGFLRRAAFALKFGEYNLLGSSLINTQSRVLWVRDVRARVAKVAPFLSLDADPYPVAVDGKILWVVDGYTTTSHYPYSQDADTSQLAAGSGLNKNFNYVRNSVKAVVNAYDGSVTLYRIDDTDPIAGAWAKIFPNLMKPKSAMPAALRDHLRYPEDLLTVQTAQLGKYHLNQPDAFFNSDLRWCVSQEVPGEQTNDTAVSTAAIGVPGVVATSAASSSTKCNDVARFIPYYSLFTPPGSSQQQFALIRPFAPFSPDDSLQVLQAFATGTVGTDLVPKLTLYTVQSPQPPGPYTAHLQVQSELSQAFTLEDSKGSKVLFGDMQLVPVGKGLLYVRPVYVRAEGQSAIPDLRYVVVIGNGSIGYSDSLTGALNSLFPGAQVELGDRPAVASNGPGSTTTTTVAGSTGAETIGQLLADATQLFADADAALHAGDLGTYQAKVQAAKAKVAQAVALLGGTSGATGAVSSAPGVTDSVPGGPTTTVAGPPPTA